MKDLYSTDFKVQIIYKSGHSEITTIPMLEYSEALILLQNEGRLVSIEIL